MTSGLSAISSAACRADDPYRLPPSDGRCARCDPPSSGFLQPLHEGSDTRKRLRVAGSEIHKNADCAAPAQAAARAPRAATPPPRHRAA